MTKYFWSPEKTLVYRYCEGQKEEMLYFYDPKDHQWEESHYFYMNKTTLEPFAFNKELRVVPIKEDDPRVIRILLDEL
jgi:hypothetical protein